MKPAAGTDAEPVKPVSREADITRLPDPDLLERARRGDVRAFEAIVRRHARTLYRTARAILRNDADAEDSVQDTYLQAHRALNSFRGEAKLSTWLVRIAVNEALMRRRRAAWKTRAVPLEALELASPAQQHDPLLRRLLERSVDALPSCYRAVFALRAVQELSVEETSAALVVPESTVRTRYFRACRLLRDSVARYAPGSRAHQQ